MASSRTFDTLAVHDFIAIFDRIESPPCRFRTSLCPNDCGHSKPTAFFTIVSYNNHEKNGEYGDEKMKDGQKWQASLNECTADVVATVRGLSPGARVRVKYDHIYVKVKNADGTQASFPERPVRSIVGA
eukprot:TRINITY_DN3614_c0_g1_i1.p1 TRINITY_DN3614_c0_g1~~TRINITY_DN3614_c0_g1_i1.p1  ORF type:complete len:129 (-),score=6.54 TRINITY_DN3614_c0_g1_i1:168-554(-)